MKKALIKALLIFIFTGLAWLIWQGRSVQSVRAVEIQPGSPRTSEPTGSIVLAGDHTRGKDATQAILQSASLALSGVKQGTTTGDLPALEDFITHVYNGQAGEVRGLYIPGLIALRIVQQPDGQVDYISAEADTATQFQSPALFGVIGLLAHNFLSGASFFQILTDQMMTIIYGDGQTEDFRVNEIHDYQRLTELDLHSDFQDPGTNQTISADQVYRRYYQGKRHLTLQTCLERDGNLNWGIRMITAFPVSPSP